MTKLEELQRKMKEMQIRSKVKAEKICEDSYKERFSILRESFKTVSDEEIRQMLRK